MVAARDGRLHHCGHGDHREDNEPDREPRERSEIGPQVPNGGTNRGAEEQGRQEDEENEVRLEGDARQSRNEREAKAAEHEQRGVGHADAASDLEEDRDGDEDRQNGGQQIHGRLVTSRRRGRSS